MAEKDKIKAFGQHIIKGVYTQDKFPFNNLSILEEKDFIIKGVNQLLEDFDVKVDKNTGDILDIKVEKEDGFYNAVVNFVLGLSLVKRKTPEVAKNFIEEAQQEPNKLPGIIESLQKEGEVVREAKRKLERYTQYNKTKYICGRV